MCQNSDCQQEIVALHEQMAIIQNHIDDLQCQVASHHANGHQQHLRASRQNRRPGERTGWYT